MNVFEVTPSEVRNEPKPEIVFVLSMKMSTPVKPLQRFESGAEIAVSCPPSTGVRVLNTSVVSEAKSDGETRSSST